MRDRSLFSFYLVPCGFFKASLHVAILRWNGSVLGEALQPAQAVWTDCGANSGWQVGTVPDGSCPPLFQRWVWSGKALPAAGAEWDPQSRPPQQSVRHAEAEKPELHPGQLWKTLCTFRIFLLQTAHLILTLPSSFPPQVMAITCYEHTLAVPQP